jgi:hypothetical protein
LLSFAIERGIRPVTDFKITKHLHLRDNFEDYPNPDKPEPRSY